MKPKKTTARKLSLDKTSIIRLTQSQKKAVIGGEAPVACTQRNCVSFTCDTTVIPTL